MIDIPPEIQITSTIKAGSVYYFPEQSFFSEEPHYFIVINNNPLTDEALLLVCASSQIEAVKRRTRKLECTTVVIKKSQYAGFTKDSIVDCNHVLSKKIKEIETKLSQGELKLKPEMDIALIEKLRKAVMRSPMVEGDKKRFVSPW